MTFIGKKTLDGPVRLFVVFSCHASFNLFMTLTLLKIIIQLFWIWACLMSVPSWLGSGYLVFLSEIPPRPLHLLIFHFEIVVISHTFIRNNAERSQIPFTHLPLDVKSSLTIVNITTRILMLIQSTNSQIFPVKLVLVCVWLFAISGDCRHSPDTVLLSQGSAGVQPWW